MAGVNVFTSIVLSFSGYFYLTLWGKTGKPLAQRLVELFQTAKLVHATRCGVYTILQHSSKPAAVI